MYVHPGDPSRNILDLPRVVSNEEDIARILDQQLRQKQDFGSGGQRPRSLTLDPEMRRILDPGHLDQIW